MSIPEVVDEFPSDPFEGQLTLHNGVFYLRVDDQWARLSVPNEPVDSAAPKRSPYSASIAGRDGRSKHCLSCTCEPNHYEGY